ncbi:MAG: zinc finger domain-containing protein [Candidatus Diapherotrites archaeon]|nr:zinc finger domain-containing protein [Candidatus Diapherotrites archaeon]
MKKCGTCNTTITRDYINFKCPSCGKGQIVRCEHCKETAKTYTCTECGFMGP